MFGIAMKPKLIGCKRSTEVDNPINDFRAAFEAAARLTAFQNRLLCFARQQQAPYGNRKIFIAWPVDPRITKSRF